MELDRPLGPLVSADWLVGHRDLVVVADVRWYPDGTPGRDAYRAGHIDGAVWIDLEEVLSGPPSTRAGRHPLPSPETFAAGLAATGISEDDTVVAYDDAGGMAAGRLVWLLRILGCPAVLLDGGIGGWPEPLRSGEESRRPATFSPRPWPRPRLATIDEISSLVAGRAVPGGRDAILVDARAAQRYRGDAEALDPRAGHIPGALNLAYQDNLRSDGRFLGADELRTRFASAGIDDETDVVVYCGSGISACHDLLAMEAAGLRPGRLYPGSWSQWSSDRGRPARVGPRP